MKNDINLLFKRRVKTYSSKNILMLLFTVLLIGVVVFFAIKLPSDSLQAAKIDAARIDKDLAASAVDSKDLAKKTEQKTNLDLLLANLNALKVSKADIINYIEVIESLRPSNIYVRKIETDPVAGQINLSGVTDLDKSIALFCLNLREKKNEQEQKVFNDIFLSYSTTMESGTISFGITITLPSSLDSSTIIQEIQLTDDATLNTAGTGEENNK